MLTEPTLGLEKPNAGESSSSDRMLVVGRISTLMYISTGGESGI